ncbi:hypothetical protein LSH36_14g07061 [Paralvinella palmiformis]|uniref:Homeobox domain-containing protein n=1 Tax=Paralvinella palmiformis TaxID=53620 RepID=A0AAD9KCI9_9ANNE|nr:hypothetical protein LSH36_14g07061 [Paralvinella palmiformis]
MRASHHTGRRKRCPTPLPVHLTRFCLLGLRLKVVNEGRLRNGILSSPVDEYSAPEGRLYPGPPWETDYRCLVTGTNVTHPPLQPAVGTNASGDKMAEAWQEMVHDWKTRTKDKYRIVYSEYQKVELEKEYLYSKYITIQRKAELARAIGLSERQVKIWFQNRRAKERKQKRKREESATNTSGSSDIQDMKTDLVTLTTPAPFLGQDRIKVESDDLHSAHAQQRAQQMQQQHQQQHH